jgi:hypothetical protein
MAKKKAAVKKVEGKVGLKKKTSKKATKKKGAVRSNLLSRKKFKFDASGSIDVESYGNISLNGDRTVLTMVVAVVAKGGPNFDDFGYTAEYKDANAQQWRSTNVVPTTELGIKKGKIKITFEKVRVGLDETLVDDELVVTILTSKSNRA